MKLIRNIKAGKVNFLNFLIIIFCFICFSNAKSLENSETEIEKFIEIKILDKVSSKTNLLKLKIGEDLNF